MHYERIVIILCLISLLFCLIILFRNHKVYKFRHKLLIEESNWWTVKISGGKPFIGFLWFDSLESYCKMLLKFWEPLDTFIVIPLEDYYKKLE